MARKVAEITVLAVAAAVPQEAKETVAVTAIVKVAPEAVIAAVALRRGEAAREVVIAAAALLAVVLAAADGAAAGAAAEVGMAEVAECARKAVGMRLGHTRTTLCLLCPTMIFSMELVVLEV